MTTAVLHSLINDLRTLWFDGIGQFGHVFPGVTPFDLAALEVPILEDLVLRRGCYRVQSDLTFLVGFLGVIRDGRDRYKGNKRIDHIHFQCGLYISNTGGVSKYMYIW